MIRTDALLRQYDRARAYTDDLWKDLTPDEVTWRPHENSSAVGGHLGHQVHVAHFVIRNLTAAEPSPDPEPDGLMDSANENWNSANHDLFHGKDGDLTGSDKESQDLLSEEKWQTRLTGADRRALSPLFWTHVNPYGRFELDTNSHLDLVAAAASMVPGPRTVPEAEAARSAADGGSGSAS